MARAHLEQQGAPGAGRSEFKSSSNQDLALFVSKIACQPTLLDQVDSGDFLTKQIGLRLYEFMFKPEEELDISLSLTALGIDSLVAIDIRNWWRQTFGLDLSVLEIMGASSIKALGRLAADGLKREYSNGPVAGQK